jgi:hypothetical protein
MYYNAYLREIGVGDSHGPACQHRGGVRIAPVALAQAQALSDFVERRA